MGNIGLYGAVHMETCGNGNSKGVIINWVLCPIVTATATTKLPLPLPQLSVNERGNGNGNSNIFSIKNRLHWTLWKCSHRDLRQRQRQPIESNTIHSFHCRHRGQCEQALTNATSLKTYVKKYTETFEMRFTLCEL